METFWVLMGLYRILLSPAPDCYNWCMRTETIEILCNPYKGEPFRLEGDQLVGAASGQRFPIRDGIPVILAEPSISARSRWFRWFYNQAAFAYDRILDLGDLLGVNSEGLVRENYVGELNLPKGGRALEIGAGTGSNRLALPRGCDYYGLDLSRRMLKRARRKTEKAGLKAEWVQGDGAYLPFRDDTFDLVFQMGALQFFADPFRGVSEMARVAKPGTSVHVIDEVGGAVRTLKRLPAHAQYAADQEKAVGTMTRLIPASMIEVNSATIPGSNFYALSFTKPEFPQQF